MKKLIHIFCMFTLVVGLAFSVPAQKDDQPRPPKKPPVRDPKEKPPKDPPKGPKKPGMESYLV